MGTPYAVRAVAGTMIDSRYASGRLAGLQAPTTVRTSDALAAGRSDAPAPSPALAPPPGNPRFPLFDGLRGMAVLAILAFHVLELTDQIGVGVAGRGAEVAGFQAVIAFFVISGFLLYRPYVAARAHDRARPNAKRYARRRALRILPAYWTVLTLLAIFPGIVGVFTGDWWRYYFYLQVYSYRTQLAGIPVAWTLCVEVTFYILLPFWAAAMRRIPIGRGSGDLLRSELPPLALLVVGGAAVQLAAAKQLVSHAVAISLPGQCAWIAIGMAFAVISVAIEQDSGRFGWVRGLGDHPGLCWLVAVVAFVLLMPLMPSGGIVGLIATVSTNQSGFSTVAKVLLQGVLVVFLVLPAIFGHQRHGFPRRLLRSAFLVWLGVISYSFYLWHLTIAMFIAQPRNPGAFSASGLGLFHHLRTARGLVLYVVIFAATAAVATVSYRLLELPFLKRKET